MANYSLRLINTLEKAKNIAKKANKNYVDTAHFLQAVLATKDGLSYKCFYKRRRGKVFWHFPNEGQ